MEIQKILKPEELDIIKKIKHPEFMQPMLATLTEEYFDDKDWIYERKLDGVRCLVSIKAGKATLFSRNQNDITHSYFELPQAMEKHNYPDLIAVGEIVAFEGNNTSFSKLQGRMQLKDKKKLQETQVKIYLYLFDIFFYDGYILNELVLRSRKKILKNAITWESNIRYSNHRNGNGIKFLEEACNKNWEGIIAKNAVSTYVHGRSKQWLKFKCDAGQELVIGGFTEPQGEREGFGAMLVGYYKEGNLQYAGKVGTGFDDAFLRKWRKEFDKIIQKSSPFVDFNKSNTDSIYWIKPQYVGQFGFTEWTKTNKLRHPRFLGMRDDKEPKKVVKE